MITPTPISNPGITQPGAPFPEPDIGSLPQPGAFAGLDLQDLANAFFRALPGDAPALTVPPNPAPVPALTTDPASVGSLPGSRSQGRAIPLGGAPALPSVAAPRGPSRSAYYFLDADAPVPGAADSLGDLARQGLGLDQVTVRPHAMPGQEGLEGLFPFPSPFGAAPAGAASPSSSLHGAEPRFSFLDHAAHFRAGQGGALPLGGALGSLLDVEAIRRDFPILAERVNGKPFIWFDNAATTQKPRAVIDRISHFYAHENSNIHRAAHELAARATDAYEGARRKVAEFLGAKGPEEIIFVRGATEAINLVARTYGRQEIGAGDEILVSHLEHHANIVPWRMLAENKGARLKVIPVDDNGQIRLDEYARLLTPRTRLVAITQVSNALGTVTPVAEMIAMAHASGARVLVDGAQAVSHMRVDVRALDADFYVFSGHKVFGPTGIGVVYAKRDLLERMPPWQGGGNMIADVTFEQVSYQSGPARFEAGTGNIADAVGLGAALDYVQKIGLERISQYEHFLLEYATERLRPIPGVRLVGTAREKASVLSFVLKGYKTEEVGEALNREGIAVRSGHHCAQPILRRLGLETTVRPSLAFYNTCEEVDVFIGVVRKLSGLRKT